MIYIKQELPHIYSTQKEYNTTGCFVYDSSTKQVFNREIISSSHITYAITIYNTNWNLCTLDIGDKIKDVTKRFSNMTRLFCRWYF